MDDVITGNLIFVKIAVITTELFYFYIINIYDIQNFGNIIAIDFTALRPIMFWIRKCEDMTYDNSALPEMIARFYNASREINRVCGFKKNRNHLTRRTAKVVVNTLKFPVAWIALLDSNLELDYLAECGFDKDLGVLRSKLNSNEFPEAIQRIIKDKQIVVLDERNELFYAPDTADVYVNYLVPINLEDKLYAIAFVCVPASENKSEHLQNLLRDFFGDMAYSLDCLGKNHDLRQMLQDTKDGILMIDNQLNILEVNTAFCDLMEAEANEFIGENAIKIVSRLMERSSLKKIVEVSNDIEKGNPIGIFEIPFKDKVISISTSFKALSQHSMVIVRDVTAPKKKESELKESEVKYKTLVNALKQSIFILQEGVIKFVNPAFVETFGYSESDIIGKNFLDFVAKREHNRISEFYVQRLRGQYVPTSYESIGVSKDGKEIELEVNSTPIEYEGAFALQVVMRDITRMNKVLTELQESEERARFLNESTFEGIVVHKRGVVIDANESFFRMTGYSREEAIGQNLLTYLATPQDKAKVLLNIVKPIAKPYEITGTRKNGSRFIAEIEGRNVKRGGRTIRIVAIRDVTERVEMRQKIKKEKEFNQKIIELSPAFILLVDKNGCIKSMNKSMLRTLNYSTEEVVGKKCTDLFPNESHGESIVSGFKELKSRTEVLIRQNHLLKKGGAEILVEWYGTTIIDDETKDITYLGIGIDITDRNEYEEKLIRNEKRFRSIFENKGTATAILNAEGYVLKANRQCSTLSGFTVKELENGLTWMDFVSANDKEFFSDQKRKWEQSPKEVLNSFEVELKRKDHAIRNVLVNIQVVDENNHRIVTLVDITDRKRSEMKLAKSENRYKLLFEASPVPLWEEDLTGLFEYLDRLKANGIEDVEQYLNDHREVLFACINKIKVLNVNQATIDLHGASSKEELINNLDKVFTERYHKLLTREFAAFARGENTYAEEIEALTLSGELLYIQLNIQVERSERKVIVATTDITETVLYKKQLTKAKEKAEESDKLKSSFLANMSHEIRTPMNGILGFANILEDEGLTGEEQQEYVAIIQKSGERMLNTINDIIDISKIESGQEKLFVRKTNVDLLIQDLYAFFLPEAKRKGLELVRTGVLKQYELSTDPDKLNSIFTNLIKNALKFTKHGRILMHVESDEDSFRFKISDTGVGIPANRQQAVFERFVQADLEDTRSFEGSGLGLAISKSYIDMLGGTISMKSEEGVGTTFLVEFPCVSEKLIPEDLPENNDPANKTEWSKIKVLIAEDDETSMQFLCEILKDITSEIIQAHNGKEAVALLNENEDTDLVLMDIKMPVQDGLSATRQIRAANNNVVIIAQTAYAQADEIDRAKTAGCDDVITKPVSKATLLKMISNRF